MKKYIILILIIILSSSSVLAEKRTFNDQNQPDVIIKNGYKPEITKSAVTVENNAFTIEPIQKKPLPKSITEHKIEYNNNGRPDYMPYALNDILIEY